MKQSAGVLCMSTCFITTRSESRGAAGKAQQRHFDIVHVITVCSLLKEVHNARKSVKTLLWFFNNSMHLWTNNSASACKQHRKKSPVQCSCEQCKRQPASQFVWRRGDSFLSAWGASAVRAAGRVCSRFIVTCSWCVWRLLSRSGNSRALNLFFLYLRKHVPAVLSIHFSRVI